MPRLIGGTMATKDLKTEVVAVRMTPTELQRLADDANTVGLGVSTYLRQLAITQSKRHVKDMTHE